MIIDDRRKPSVSTLDGERAEFRIATNAKAFRVLVDSIYSDKVGSITRELLSNAWDAHVRNGNPEVQFEVRIPNALNPTFSVRDYGCSMTHEFVMESYSTLFESSKTGSNVEVGAFGLGAKSFLAYTDACTLTCWLDGQRRSYTISLGDNGVPEVMLVHAAPSDEPQGVEVTFAVERTDFSEFATAARRCAYGFDVLPRFVGDEVVPVDPDFKGDGWRYWHKSPLGDRSMVRQGCAVYPLPRYYSGLPSDGLMIIDVPIGSANVTASREALALTYEQREAIDAVLIDKIAALADAVKAEYFAITSPVARARFAVEHQVIIGRSDDFPQSVQTPKPLHKFDGGVLAPYSSFHASSLDRIILLHDDGTPTPRRLMRLRALAKVRSVYVETDRDVIVEAAKFLELSPSQVKPMSSIPDVQRRQGARSGGGSTGQTKPKAESGLVWAISSYSTIEAGDLEWKRDEPIGKFPSGVSGWIKDRVAERNNGKDLMLVTPSEAKRLLDRGTLDKSLRLDQFVRSLMGTDADKAALEQHLLTSAIRSMSGWRVNRILCDHLNLRQDAEFPLIELYRRLASDLVTSIHTEKVAPLVKSLRAQYPMLWGDDEITIRQYINFCDAQRGDVADA